MMYRKQGLRIVAARSSTRMPPLNFSYQDERLFWKETMFLSQTLLKRSYLQPL